MESNKEEVTNHVKKAYSVYWIKNSRIGSFETDSQNAKEMFKLFNMSLIQTDITGTKHYEILGEKNKQEINEILKQMINGGK